MVIPALAVLLAACPARAAIESDGPIGGYDHFQSAPAVPPGRIPELGPAIEAVGAHLESLEPGARAAELRAMAPADPAARVLAAVVARPELLFGDSHSRARLYQMLGREGGLALEREVLQLQKAGVTVADHPQFEAGTLFDGVSAQRPAPMAAPQVAVRLLKASAPADEAAAAARLRTLRGSLKHDADARLVAAALTDPEAFSLYAGEIRGLVGPLGMAALERQRSALAAQSVGYESTHLTHLLAADLDAAAPGWPYLGPRQLLNGLVTGDAFHAAADGGMNAALSRVETLLKGIDSNSVDRELKSLKDIDAAARLLFAAVSQPSLVNDPKAAAAVDHVFGGGVSTTLRGAAAVVSARLWPEQLEYLEKTAPAGFEGRPAELLKLARELPDSARAEPLAPEIAAQVSRRRVWEAREAARRVNELRKGLVGDPAERLIAAAVVDREGLERWRLALEALVGPAATRALLAQQADLAPKLTGTLSRLALTRLSRKLAKAAPDWRDRGLTRLLGGMEKPGLLVLNAAQMAGESSGAPERSPLRLPAPAETEPAAAPAVAAAVPETIPATVPALVRSAALGPARVQPLDGSAEKRVRALGLDGAGVILDGRPARLLSSKKEDDLRAVLMEHPDDPSVAVKIYHSRGSLAGAERVDDELARLAPLAAAGAAPQLLERGEARVPGEGLVHFYARRKLEGVKLAALSAAEWPERELAELLGRLKAGGLALVAPARETLLRRILVAGQGDARRAYLLDGQTKPASGAELDDNQGLLASLLRPPLPAVEPAAPPAAPAAPAARAEAVSAPVALLPERPAGPAEKVRVLEEDAGFFTGFGRRKTKLRVQTRDGVDAKAVMARYSPKVSGTAGMTSQGYGIWSATFEWPGRAPDIGELVAWLVEDPDVERVFVQRERFEDALAAARGARFAGAKRDWKEAFEPEVAGLAARFVPIKAGTFTLGSPDVDKRRSRAESIREASLDAFELQATQATQLQYYLVMGHNPSTYKDRIEGEDGFTRAGAVTLNPQLPVETLTWDQANEFVKRLNELQSEYVYSLPTEAQWEYAAQAGLALQPFPFGDNRDGLLAEHAWYRANSGGRPNSVGRKKPNAWGLYDMNGNVWEWVCDHVDMSRIYGWTGAWPMRLLKGGAADSKERAVRSAVRGTLEDRSDQDSKLPLRLAGLRLARTKRRRGGGYSI